MRFEIQSNLRIKDSTKGDIETSHFVLYKKIVLSLNYKKVNIWELKKCPLFGLSTIRGAIIIIKTCNITRNKTGTSRGCNLYLEDVANT